MSNSTDELVNNIIKFPDGEIDNPVVEAAVAIGGLALIGGALFGGYKYVTDKSVRDDVNDVIKDKKS